MIALEQVRQYLETLGLKQAVEVLDNTLDAAASKQLTYPEMLAELLGVEVAARRERYLTTRTRLAHLPFHPNPPKRWAVAMTQRMMGKGRRTGLA